MKDNNAASHDHDCLILVQFPFFGWDALQSLSLLGGFEKVEINQKNQLENLNISNS